MIMTLIGIANPAQPDVLERSWRPSILYRSNEPESYEDLIEDLARFIPHAARCTPRLLWVTALCPNPYSARPELRAISIIVDHLPIVCSIVPPCNPCSPEPSLLRRRCNDLAIVRDALATPDT